MDLKELSDVQLEAAIESTTNRVKERDSQGLITQAGADALKRRVAYFAEKERREKEAKRKSAAEKAAKLVADIEAERERVRNLRKLYSF